MRPGFSINRVCVAGAIAFIFAGLAACEKKDQPAKKWALEIREDSSEPQKAHLMNRFAPARGIP